MQNRLLDIPIEHLVLDGVFSQTDVILKFMTLIENPKGENCSLNCLFMSLIQNLSYYGYFQNIVCLEIR